jgi:hypothetical protein
MLKKKQNKNAFQDMNRGVNFTKRSFFICLRKSDRESMFEEDVHVIGVFWFLRRGRGRRRGNRGFSGGRRGKRGRRGSGKGRGGRRGRESRGREKKGEVLEWIKDDWGIIHL